MVLIVTKNLPSGLNFTIDCDAYEECCDGASGTFNLAINLPLVFHNRAIASLSIVAKRSYRNYRNTAEGLKIEGWEFFQLTGAYRQFESHTYAYTAFAQRVEQYIKQDVQGFIAQLEEKDNETKKKTEATDTQDAELTPEKLNQQLQLQLANFEAQLKQLELQKRRLEEQKQQLEQDHSVQPQSNGEKPADQGTEVALDNLPSIQPQSNDEKPTDQGA